MDIKEGQWYIFYYRSVREESVYGKFLGFQIIGSITFIKIEAYLKDEKKITSFKLQGTNLIYVEDVSDPTVGVEGIEAVKI